MIFPEQYRTDGIKNQNGAFIIKINKAPFLKTFFVIASRGEGWEHVSVTLLGPDKNRCPTWEEMCFIKDLFFLPEEAVVQYHPPHSQYVNRHRYCLHLWKKQDFLYPLPPTILV